MREEVMEYIKNDELDKAIAAISSPEERTRFERRLKMLGNDSMRGVLSYEQITLTRNKLANDLIDFFSYKKSLSKLKIVSGTLRVKEHAMDKQDRVDSGEALDAPELESVEDKPASKLVESQLDRQKSDMPFYKKWWFSRIIAATIIGAIVAYFGMKYAALHFGDTWLAITSVVSAFLLMRNPNRVYLRWAAVCISLIGSANILSQIDTFFNITNTTNEERPWEFFFKLGFGDEPIVTVVLGVIAIVLFVLDFKMRKKGS